MKHLGDITQINGAEIEPVWCITFGAPCQDLSVAGKRAGLKHSSLGDEETTRSGLFMEAVRIIKEMREHEHRIGADEPVRLPRFAIYENVPGALSSSGGEDWRTVLECLCRLADEKVCIPKPNGKWPNAGCIVGDTWSAAWRIMDAQHYGVPQRRRRVALIVDFAGKCAGEILFERESLPGYPEPRFEAWKGIAHPPKECAGECCEASTLKIRGGCQTDANGRSAGKGALIQKDLSATLAATQDQTLF